MKLFRIFACSVILNMAMLMNAAVVSAQPAALSGGTSTFMESVKFIDGLVPPLADGAPRAIADGLSWGTAIAAVALDTRASWQAPNRTRAFVAQGVRIGVTYALVFTAKKLVRRTRPCAKGLSGAGGYDTACGIDNPDFSFYSAHSAVAAASGQPVLAGLTAAGRVLGAKHWLTDVAVGLAQGWVVRKVIR